MSATMIMPSHIDAAIQDMFKSGMIQVVNALADKYKFDAFEANLFLNTIDAKIVRERGPTPNKEKKPKKEKKDDSSDDEKPKKKRVSGYILFSNANRDDVKTKLTTGDEKPKNTEVMKELASMWKDLTDEERGEWNTKAQELKDGDN